MEKALLPHVRLHVVEFEWGVAREVLDAVRGDGHGVLDADVEVLLGHAHLRVHGEDDAGFERLSPVAAAIVDAHPDAMRQVAAELE